MRISVRVRVIVVLSFVWTTIHIQAFAGGPRVLAGPMLGHVTENSATVWLRLAPGVNASGEAVQIGRRVAASGERILNNEPEFQLLRFTGLLSGQPAHVVVQAAAMGEAPEVHDLFFELPAPPENTGTVRIAFGSCSQDSRRPYAPVYEAIAYERPDVTLFVGDNSYFIVGDGIWSTSGPIGDWDSAKQMIDRHMITRTNPYIQRLLRSVPCYAIWDDHDYGPNNTDRTFANKEAALNVFRLVWANPSYGTDTVNGIFSKFRRGPAEVFLMDDRYHKWVATDAHPDVPAAEAAIWGNEQLEWLLDGLRRSPAPVKIIANGTQIISKDGRGEGHLNEAPEEFRRLLDFLKANRIGGVIVLSGDRHFTEVMRLSQEGGPDILEFTSSPIQQGQAVAPLEREHETHVWAMRGNSYGLVTITVESNGEGLVRFEMRDANNQVPLRAPDQPAMSEFSLKSLMYPE